ncbi:MAG: 2-amino-4-hydroxy-6-hydroxymethyldihydropteridine diphosphokinase [Candidatus Omnitrophica bacterium]|nr:2-amino-4-hydroxy-6-hydroxymethyldihydropteridine diphosphokinase [Candidatus Omnitrophota bacterium]MDD5352681.1 2-amino-4-hydroxy-6-hydroxymethyldihydropteridine diphosphokinase [Candidatus Omnitrophota bacterium]MDD5550280.1 2-amino-4-hydroxy-6-hydroxymethyldihydropteridine diphosphokinase [Candidatus Omnitrophota bacterium]
MALVTSYLAIGSNLGNRLANIKESLRYLKEINRIHIDKISPIYESSPEGGPKNQPKYLNLALKIKTALAPFDLLNELKIIEKKLKRRNKIHWGPRTIDLDILFYGDLILSSRALSLPHNLLHKRIFVLNPLVGIAPNFIHPVYNKSVKELLRGLKNGNKKIVPFN